MSLTVCKIGIIFGVLAIAFLAATFLRPIRLTQDEYKLIEVMVSEFPELQKFVTQKMNQNDFLQVLKNYDALRRGRDNYLQILEHHNRHSEGENDVKNS